MKKIYDYGIALMLLVISALFFFESKDIPESYGDLKVFPFWILGLTVFLAVYIFLKALLRKKENSQEDPLKGSKRVWIHIAIFILYTLLTDLFGFMISTPIYIVLGCYQLGQRSWKVIAATAIIMPVLCYFVFLKAMQIYLPIGILTKF